MKPNILKALLFLLMACISVARIGHCQDIYQIVHKKADLPTGGEFVPNPKTKSEIYYFTNRMRMYQDKSNAQKHSGLYHSTDDGQTWKLICYFFEFEKLFIHPVTGKLFAIIQDTYLAEDEGFLVPITADKVITSADGARWDDITGKHQHWQILTGIFQDPDYPDRVCLDANSGRDYVLQSKDAAYTDWNWTVVWEWTRQHPPKAK